MAQTVKVSKWGNSFGIRIPKYITDEFDIKAGKYLKVMYIDGKIILQVKPSFHEDIREWFRYIEANNIHPDE